MIFLTAIEKAPEFHLPGFTLRWTGCRSDYDLLVLGGRRPEPQWLKAVAKNAKKSWAADRGVEACLAVQLEPSYVVGDFDSLSSSEAKLWVKQQKEHVVSFPVEKDLTDFQLTLQRASVTDRELVCTGFWGGRFDHAWCNVMSLYWGVLQGWPCRLAADSREILLLLGPGETAEVSFEKAPVAVSLLSLSKRCEAVTTENLHWELRDAVLENRFPYSISNKTTGSPFRVSLSSGWLGLYLCVQEEVC